jgi:hypothetical protein
VLEDSMTTVSEVIDTTYSSWLYPAGVNRPSFDVLAEEITDVQSVFSLEGRITVPKDSILEVGSELILTESVSGSEVTASERGYLGSTAATHLVNSRIYLDPMFSRFAVLKALRAIIGDLYPRGLYARVVDQNKTYTTSGVVAAPTGTKRILKISCRLSSTYEEYRRLRPERDEYDILTEFDPPKLKFRRGGIEDAVLNIVIAKDFVLPTVETDDLEDDCLLPATLVNHLPQGVAGKILQARELPRVQIEQIKRLLASQGIQVGAALNVGQALLQAFWGEVALERARLEELDPAGFELTH